MSAQSITYKPGTFPSDKEFGILGKRWSDEPLTKKLGVPSTVPMGLFPGGTPELCVMAYDCDEPIGYTATNKWVDFVAGVEKNLKKLKDTHCSEPNILNFLEIVEQAVKFERNFFRLESDAKMNSIAHSCGLIVVESHSNKGIGTELYRRRERLLKEKGGFGGIVIETTNGGSAGAAKKNDFKKLWSYNYKDNGIDLDGEYAVWIKWL